jgi:RNA polymerase sigma factor for flagellar operon FliA
MTLQMEEKVLIDQYIASRSPELRERLIMQSVPLVHFILGRLGISQDFGTEYEDLVHQGLLGLIDAVDRYNPNHGAQFSTYASVRIRGKVLDYLRTSDWMSRSARQKSRQIQKTISDLWAVLQREPTDDEIADHLGIEKSQVQKNLVEQNTVFVSIDSSIEVDQDGEGDLHEILMDDQQPNPASVIEDNSMKQELIKGIQKLAKREQTILSLYYHDELTFKEIGQVLDLTESRVCQLHARAILNLKVMVNHE